MTSPIDATPRHTHDCDACRFLGHVSGIDLYHCARQRVPTCVGRYSSRPPDYCSGPRQTAEMLPDGHPIKLAWQLAARLGLTDAG